MSSKPIHILEIDSVELSFGERQILTNVYLRMETGRISALLGRNGSGKSCLMRVLFGELSASYKSMRIDTVWHKRFSNSQVLYLPQYPSIPNHLRVDSVFKDFAIPFDGFVDTFPQLGYLKTKRIGEISSGEKRIVEIYTILKSDSLFVMLDEPFSQIMPLHVETIRSLISEEKQNKGILITDHMYKNVLDISDSLYVISNQTVYLAKTPEDLIKYGYVNHIVK